MTVGGETVAEIGAGLCILLGVAEADGESEAVRLANKAATALVVLFGVEAKNAPAPFQTYPYTLTACPASYAHQVDPITDVFYGAATGARVLNHIRFHIKCRGLCCRGRSSAYCLSRSAWARLTAAPACVIFFGAEWLGRGQKDVAAARLARRSSAPSCLAAAVAPADESLPGLLDRVRQNASE